MPQSLPNYDASFCGKLPLHQTNLIQPHGCLFVLAAATLEILQVSDNVQDIILAGPETLVGTSFSLLVDEATQVQLAQLAGKDNTEKRPVQVNFVQPASSLACSGLVHGKDGMLLLEVHNPQLASGKGRSFLDVYQQVKALMHGLNNCTAIPEFASLVAKEIRNLTGFDKVMVYCFDATYNGTVIAEEKEAEMDAYMGLRFPASDIPKPAREMYLKNPYRFIPNSGYKPARLYPLINPNTYVLTDLSGCDLRSVAAVHVEYLKNMGVLASLSLRLVHNGKLWGLVSCHHRTPKYFSFETMGMFELLSDIISAQLSIILNNAVSATRNQLQETLTHLVPKLNKEENLQEGLLQHAENVQSLLTAGGLAFNLNGHIQTAGQVPESIDLHRLFFWLQVQSPTSLMHQPALPLVFDEAESFAHVGSGILALPLVPEKGQFLVAFRPEAVEEVAWGGNPHEALQFESDGKTYHPRNSFQIWKQKVRHTAKPWSTEELSVAEAFQNVLTGLVLRRLHA